MFTPVRNLHRRLAMLVVVVASGWVSTPAMAQFFVSDSFSYGVGNNLAGQNVGVGDWNGSWSALAGTVISNVDLQYTSGDLRIFGGGQSVRITNTNHESAISRRFAAQVNSPTLYFSLLFRVEAGSDAGDFIHFMLNNDAGTTTSNNNSAGIGDMDTGNVRFSTRIGGSNGGSTVNASVPPGSTAKDYELNTTYLLVAKVENVNLTGGTDPNEANEPDRITLWVNPTTYSESSPGTSWISGQGNLGATFSTFEYFTIRTFGLDSPGDQYYFDELRIGTTWMDVVPEPSSLSLIGLAGVGLLHRRRRAL